jgi:hypothetical protein
METTGVDRTARWVRWTEVVASNVDENGEVVAFAVEMDVVHALVVGEVGCPCY